MFVSPLLGVRARVYICVYTCVHAHVHVLPQIGLIVRVGSPPSRYAEFADTLYSVSRRRETNALIACARDVSIARE